MPKLASLTKTAPPLHVELALLSWYRWCIPPFIVRWTMHTIPMIYLALWAPPVISLLLSLPVKPIDLLVRWWSWNKVVPPNCLNRVSTIGRNKTMVGSHLWSTLYSWRQHKFKIRSGWWVLLNVCMLLRSKVLIWLLMIGNILKIEYWFGWLFAMRFLPCPVK